METGSSKGGQLWFLAWPMIMRVNVSIPWLMCFDYLIVSISK